MKVDQDVLEVLQHVDCLGDGAVITEKLERAMYIRVNKVLELAGGKWSRSSQSHSFNGESAEAIIDQILLTGEVQNAKQELGAFDTPVALVQKMIAKATSMTRGNDLKGKFVLEPSAGNGRIAFAARDAGASVVAVEIDLKKMPALHEGLAPIPVFQGDFLSMATTLLPVVDTVLMNPPFAKQADVEHIAHAARFIKPGGNLVAIASASVAFRDNRKGHAFRDLIAMQHGVIEPLPEGSFKESGTMVNTVMVTMQF